MEKWKDIDGLEGYQVSSEGRVKSMPKEICVPDGQGKMKKVMRGELILKPTVGKGGYLYIGLSKDGKRVRKAVHRLVAEAFVEKNGLPRVRHKDGNTENNEASNLEWCSVKDSMDSGKIKETKRRNKRKREIERAKTERPDEDCTDATLWDTYMGEKHGAWYVEYAKECIPEPEMRIKMWKIFDSVENG